MNVEFVTPAVEFLRGPSYDEALLAIEESARVSHRSEERNECGHFNACLDGQHPVDCHWDKTIAERFVETWAIRHGDHSILEYPQIAFRITADRGFLAEITRHRHFSFTVESTRFVNYGKKGSIRFIVPPWSANPGGERWIRACQDAAAAYQHLLEVDWTPEQARSVLPMALATRIDIQGSIRTWREMLPKRIAHAAHPQMRQIAHPILKCLRMMYGVLFSDIKIENDALLDPNSVYPGVTRWGQTILPPGLGGS